MLLEVRNLTKRYGGLAAVHELSFDVAEGEVLGLIGPNGAGKTTTFNMLSGFVKPTTGTVVFDGRSIAGMTGHAICSLGITRTFQVVQPFPEMTTLENVMVGAFIRTPDARAARRLAMETLERIGLAQKADTSAHDLTLLDLKRLEIGRALATQPRLLLLDEVAAGLKAAEIDDVLDMLRSVNAAGVTIVLVEHVMRVVAGLAQRIVVLDFGRKIAEGTFAQISEDPAVLDAYLGADTDEDEGD
jgi:branched-chain amino acid transport system ATP-binding protein